jgi:hypothetical protein
LQRLEAAHDPKARWLGAKHPRVPLSQYLFEIYARGHSSSLEQNPAHLSTFSPYKTVSAEGAISFSLGHRPKALNAP